MNELKAAVCDEEATYCERFVCYFVEHKAGSASIHTYTDRALFAQDVEREHFDVAVLGNGFKELLDEVRKIGIPVLLLSDEMAPVVAESAQFDAYGGRDGAAAEQGMVRETFRYQPIEGIWREMQILAASGMDSGRTQTSANRHVEVLGVCSPDRHEMQMPFSVVLSSQLGASRRVLYVNLMEHSGFLELFGVERAGDLGDLILRLREGTLTRECFAENLCEMEGFSCIQPFANPGNLHELQLEDVERLLRFVAEETSFETVVIDFGGGFSEFDRMLGNCKEIYCLTRRGFYYECCCRNFKDYLDRSAVEHLSERMRIVEIPYSARSIRGGGDVLRQLLWSEFGDLVRGQLAGM